MSNTMYKVLWIDDEYNDPNLQEIADKAYDEYSIELLGCESAEEGLQKLEDAVLFDAVLLDARFYLNKEDSSGAEDLKGLSKIWKKLDQLESKGIVLPRFILTGQATLLNNDTFSDTYGNFYSKHELSDINRLFNDIVNASNKRTETQIRHKYAHAFEVCTNTYIGVQNSIELMEVLKGFEAQDFKNASYFNAIRKIMEDIFNCCELLNFFSITSISMNSRSLEICRDPRVPVYIQRSIHSVVVASQNGSHRLAIDRDVASGKAPFLFASSTFELLNILFWYKDYVDNII